MKINLTPQPIFWKNFREIIFPLFYKRNPKRVYVLQNCLALIFCLTFSISSFSQTQINGIVNTYQKVSAITFPNPATCDPCSTNISCLNGITVSDGSVFTVGDEMLLIQMKGASINTSNTVSAGNVTAIGNAGNYEFFTVKSIVGNILYPNGPLLKNYDVVGLIQVVKVPNYSGDVEISGNINAIPWNPITGTGGVIALFVEGTLTLNADIDAGSIGYNGVTVNTNGSPDHCGVSPNIQMVFPSTDLNVSPKGQGIVVDDTATNGGRAPRANGGGGGIAGDSGGGGGSNFGIGGIGGKRWCNSGSGGADAGGLGGVSLSSFLIDNKVFMGGAGGAGFITNLNPAIATNGGGVVVIRASHIVGNNHTIYAQGADSTAPGSGIDGGGGGGGGGSVAFDIASYSGLLNIDVSGGNGQDLQTDVLHGPGGGGGGGAFLHNLSSLPAGINVIRHGGEAGVHNGAQSTNTNGAQDGAQGGIINYYNFVETNDNDNDGFSDFCDFDSDDDGILDSIEDGGTGVDPSGDEDGDGLPNYLDKSDTTINFPIFIDTNGDGINDVYDFDSDGIPDFQDLDSDNDGIYDVNEIGGTDTNNDGRSDDNDGDSTNNNGIPSTAGSGISPIETTTGTPDYKNLDSDSDGCSDANEAYIDANADGGDGGDYGTGTPPPTDTYGKVILAAYDTGIVAAVTDNGNTISCDPPITTDDLAWYVSGSVSPEINILDNDTTGDVIVATTVSLSLIGLPLGSSCTTTDGDGDCIAVTVPNEGVWTINTTSGVLIFTPINGFLGNPTSINYTAKDAQGSESNEATVTLTVNDLPVATANTATTSEDVAVTFNVTSDDTDTDGTIDASTVDLDPSATGKQTSITTAEGVWTVALNGDLTFTPATNYNGTATLSYTVKDNDGGQSNTAALSVTVTNPELTVTKTVTTTGSVLGDVIAYDIVVVNSGNVTVTNIDVTDANADAASITGSPIATLAPGASVTVTATQTITQAHINAGYIENSATATGDSPTGTNDVSDDSDAGDEATETNNGDGTTDGDPTNDPTVTTLTNPGSIDAVDDTATGVNGVTAATAVIDVFTNDTLNGVAVNPSEVNLTETIADPNGYLTLNGDGTIDVAEGTPSGTYQLTYQICEVLNPTNCNTAIATITVGDCLDFGTNDCDTDGLTNDEEIILGTDPNNPDSDGDGITDGQEVTDNTNPLDDCDSIGGTPLGSSDCDDDGLTNDEESALGTDPNNPDSDGDLILDGQEVTDKTDPLNPCDNVNGTPPAGTACDITIHNDLMGPGIDDGYFRILNIEQFLDNTVKIYNRWGVLVYETKGYNRGSNVFRGVSNGRTVINKKEDLPVGVYYYIIDYNNKGKNKTKTGYLYLNK